MQDSTTNANNIVHFEMLAFGGRVLVVYASVPCGVFGGFMWLADFSVSCDINADSLSVTTAVDAIIPTSI